MLPCHRLIGHLIAIETVSRTLGPDFSTGLGHPNYPLESRHVYITAEKWIPLLFVDGEERDLTPFATSGYENWTEVDGEERRSINPKDPDAINHCFEGEIDGYRFRVYREDAMVDTEVIDPDGTVWTTRSGPNGFEDHVSIIPWDGKLSVLF